MEDKKSCKEKYKFVNNELVLCYDPDPLKARMLYDAKILDVELTKDEKGKRVCEYYIHFQGWNKSWDRWILEEQILKDSELNRNLQAKLLREAIKPKKRNNKVAKVELLPDEKEDVTKQADVSLGAHGSSEEEVKVIELPSVSLDIPKVLTNRLEDDCYNIKRRKKLIHLPRKPSINDIFKQYYDYCANHAEQSEGKATSLSIVHELMDGLNTYINFCLNTLLLYNFEREQYNSFFPREKVPPHLMSLYASTPPTTPLISPKITSLTASEKHVLDSPASSRSSSRSSSFSEEFPPPTNVRKRGRRPAAATAASKQDITLDKPDKRRKRFHSNCEKPISPTENELLVLSQSSVTRSSSSTRTSSITRSSSLTRSSSVPHSSSTQRRSRVAVLSKSESTDHEMTTKSSTTEFSHRKTRSRSSSKSREEPVETRSAQINRPSANAGEGSSQLRRSSRGHKMSDGNIVELQSLPMYPKPKPVAPLNKDAQKLLTIQTVFLKAQEASDDRSFMMFPQHAHTLETPADVYGIEHLLRLFVKLPALLACSNIPQAKLNNMLVYVGKFLTYLAKRSDLFRDDVYSESVL